MFFGAIPPGLLIDHINGIKLDNRIENLRLATDSGNNSNATMSKRNKTGFKGVSFNKWAQKYEARIFNGKVKYLGVFETAEAASHAYIKAANEIKGEFSKY
jgi:hypothetical protein